MKKSKHTLTNLMISEIYRDYDYYLMKDDFIGAFAYWVYRQGDESNISLFGDAIKAYLDWLKDKLFTKSDTVLKMNYKLIALHTSVEIFSLIPEIMKLNETSKFIDLGALSRNVFYHILREQITQPL